MSSIRVVRALAVLLAVALGSAAIARVAAPVILAGITDLTTPGADPAVLAASAVTLAAAAALAVVACWVAAATTWCVVAELRTGAVRAQRRGTPSSAPWLVRHPRGRGARHDRTRPACGSGVDHLLATPAERARGPAAA